MNHLSNQVNKKRGGPKKGVNNYQENKQLHNQKLGMVINKELKNNLRAIKELTLVINKELKKIMNSTHCPNGAPLLQSISTASGLAPRCGVSLSMPAWMIARRAATHLGRGTSGGTGSPSQAIGNFQIT